MSHSKTVTTDNPVRRNLNVESAVDQLESSLVDICIVIGDLEETLQPLLSDEYPSVGSEADNLIRGTGESAVAERILVVVDKILNRESRIKNLSSRL